MAPNTSVEEMVGLGGLEPPTSRLSSARSNQLSYKPLAALSRSSPGQSPTSATARRGSCRALAARRHPPRSPGRRSAARERRLITREERETKAADPLLYLRRED